jgi:hypothetical protein
MKVGFLTNPRQNVSNFSRQLLEINLPVSLKLSEVLRFLQIIRAIPNRIKQYFLVRIPLCIAELLVLTVKSQILKVLLEDDLGHHHVLNAVFRHQAKDVDRLHLADPVQSPHTLVVSVRFPVGVKDHSNVKLSQIDSNSAYPTRDQKHDDILIACAFVKNSLSSLHTLHVAVDISRLPLRLLLFESVPIEGKFKQIQHHLVLRENDDPVALGDQVLQESEDLVELP